MFAILIPVYGVLCISVMAAIAGDTAGFMERMAKIHWGLLVCVCGLSHAPALLMLDIPGYAGQNVKLLLFLILIVESSDVLQFIWESCVAAGRLHRRSAPARLSRALLAASPPPHSSDAHSGR